jgi:hypothetical protein
MYYTLFTNRYIYLHTNQELSESSAMLEVARTFSVDVPLYGGRKSSAAATTQCADCGSSYANRARRMSKNSAVTDIITTKMSSSGVELLLERRRTNFRVPAVAL